MADPKKPVVVCVDDDDAMLTTIARCLRRDGTLEIRPTLSPQEALGWLVDEEISVVVSDYDMPEMTGAQLCGHARRMRPDTVRILLTGRRTLETAIDGINQGEIFRFIGKPFENEVLRGAVAAAVVRHDELVALSGDCQRRERREALRTALETEYPGISHVEPRGGNDAHVVTADPWSEAAQLGLAALGPAFDRR